MEKENRAVEECLEPYFLEGVMSFNSEHKKVHSDLEERFSPWRRSERSGREALKALFRAIKRKVTERKIA